MPIKSKQNVIIAVRYPTQSTWYLVMVPAVVVPGKGERQAGDKIKQLSAPPRSNLLDGVRRLDGITADHVDYLGGLP